MGECVMCVTFITALIKATQEEKAYFFKVWELVKYVWKAWWQELEETGHVTFPPGQEAKEDAGAKFTLFFSPIQPGTQSLGRCHS